MRTVNEHMISATLDDLEHNAVMMGFADEETAADDWDYYGPKILYDVEQIRGILKAAPAAPAANDQEMKNNV